MQRITWTASRCTAGSTGPTATLASPSAVGAFLWCDPAICLVAGASIAVTAVRPKSVR